MGWTQRQARPAEPPTSRSEALASCTSHLGIGSVAASLFLTESLRLELQNHSTIANPRPVGCALLFTQALSVANQGGQ